MKKGDAILSYMGGRSVWKWMNDDNNPPNFRTWRRKLHKLLKEVCFSGLHYRDWHSENVLLEGPRNSPEIGVIDPGALIVRDKVVWSVKRSANQQPLAQKFDKYEVGVSLVAIQDLLWVAVGQDRSLFFRELKEILGNPLRQALFPAWLDKG